MDTNKLNYRGKYSVINGTEIADVNAREALLELNTSLENIREELQNITTVTKTDLDSIFTGGWTVTFVMDENCELIEYYKTKDFIAEDIVTLIDGEKYCTYDKDTKKKTYYEDGQANFIVYFKNGYTVNQITVDGTYGEVKLERENTQGELDRTGNAYNVTKVQSNLVINITSKVKSATPGVTE